MDGPEAACRRRVLLLFCPRRAYWHVCGCALCWLLPPLRTCLRDRQTRALSALLLEHCSWLVCGSGGREGAGSLSCVLITAPLATTTHPIAHLQGHPAVRSRLGHGDMAAAMSCYAMLCYHTGCAAVRSYPRFWSKVCDTGMDLKHGVVDGGTHARCLLAFCRSRWLCPGGRWRSVVLPLQPDSLPGISWSQLKSWPL